MVLRLHSNPIHTIFTNCAPFPLHFHSISISIWISTPLKGSTRQPKSNPTAHPKLFSDHDIRDFVITQQYGVVYCSILLLTPGFRSLCCHRDSVGTGCVCQCNKSAVMALPSSVSAPRGRARRDMPQND